jgi:transposase-like protein
MASTFRSLPHIVHPVRHSLQYVGYKERKAVAGALQKIYRAASREEADIELEGFARKWDGKFPTIAQTWRRNRERIVPFFAYPPEIRRVIYTTNAIESTNMSLRKVLKTRGSFPTDEAALKLVYLALQNITARWTMPIKEWRAALNRFAILFEDRMPLTL